MANQEHLAKIQEGVTAWNAWRQKQPQDLRLDLLGANLAKVDLFRANLDNADLDEANLRAIRSCSLPLQI